MTDLSKHSLDDLKALKDKVLGEIESRYTAVKAKAQEEILALAQKHGIDVRFKGKTSGAAKKASKGGGKGKGSVAAKYRHPQDSSLTWTGRGRSPTWVSEWKSKHHGSLDGITIK